MKVSEIAAEVIAEVRRQLSAKDGDIREVTIEVSLIGHGARPFGNYLPNDYRDVTIRVGKAHWPQ